jgi:hypothetical protein
MAKVHGNSSKSWLPGDLTSAIPLSKKKSVRDNDKKEWLPNTLVVEKNEYIHKANGKNENSSSCGSMLNCLNNRKVVCVIIIYALVATGLWTVFLGNPFQFGREKQLTALKEQVEILDEEIDQLETQVDRLESEVTRLSNETDRLTNINDDLQLTAEDLNTTVMVLSDLNDSLNLTLATNEELSELLDGSIESAIDINNVLIDTVVDLGERIETISELNEDLKSTLKDLEEEKEEYIEITDALEKSNILLSEEKNSLEDQLQEMQSQNNILAQHNEDLQSILEFLNQAGLNLNTTMQAISEYLADEIDENSGLVLLDLEMHYEKVFSYWMCTSSFEEVYSDKTWMLNKNSAIGADDYGSVIEFVDDHVFGDLCASKTDFENFIVSDSLINYQGSIPPVEISLNTLTSSIERYSTMMIEYYFPSDGNGLSKSDWAQYLYDCSNIPPEKRYTWSA